MGFKRAAEGLTTIPVDGYGVLQVRQGISKRTFNVLLDSMPDDYGAGSDFTPRQGSDFVAGLFKALVTGWGDDDSAIESVTVDDYLALELSGAQAVDASLSEYFSSLTPSDDDRSKSKKAGK